MDKEGCLDAYSAFANFVLHSRVRLAVRVKFAFHFNSEKKMCGHQQLEIWAVLYCCLYLLVKTNFALEIKGCPSGIAKGSKINKGSIKLTSCC